jgi:hypothetical protein
MRDVDTDESGTMKLTDGYVRGARLCVQITAKKRACLARPAQHVHFPDSRIHRYPCLRPKLNSVIELSSLLFAPAKMGESVAWSLLHGVRRRARCYVKNMSSVITTHFLARWVGSVC